MSRRRRRSRQALTAQQFIVVWRKIVAARSVSQPKSHSRYVAGRALDYVCSKFQHCSDEICPKWGFLSFKCRIFGWKFFNNKKISRNFSTVHNIGRRKLPQLPRPSSPYHDASGLISLWAGSGLGSPWRGVYAGVWRVGSTVTTATSDQHGQTAACSTSVKLSTDCRRVTPTCGRRLTTTGDHCIRPGCARLDVYISDLQYNGHNTY